jgi:superfamily II DNA or RNA helicase
MNKTNGYIYVRYHLSYNNAYKIGKTINIPERDSQYATSEIKRGYFVAVFEISIKKISIIEKMIQNKFHELNIKYDAGTEFYNKKIITLIEPYLISLGIKYKKLSQQEIDNLIKINRIKIKIKIKSHILKSKINNKQYIWNERDYQKKIINFSKNELLLKNKLYIELPTGGGKSYIVKW